MKKLRMGLLILPMLLLSIWIGLAVVSAEPTPVQSKITWDDYTDPVGTGFYLYWAPETEDPRVYSNSRKVDVGLPTDIVIIDVKPDASSSLCFKMTAYNTEKKESAFSEELCGWFGLSPVQGLRIE